VDCFGATERTPHSQSRDFAPHSSKYQTSGYYRTILRIEKLRRYKTLRPSLRKCEHLFGAMRRQRRHRARSKKFVYTIYEGDGVLWLNAKYRLSTQSHCNS
jgi:hypothetical protein